MKKLVFSIVASISIICGAMSQQATKNLAEAKAMYNSGNIHEARFCLQQALNDINIAIGNEILKIIPSKLGNMPAIEAEDNVAVTNFGIAALMISRNYMADSTLNASLQIIGDSPMLAGINTILTLPMFTSDPNQKRIRVGTYKALLQKNTDGTQTTWDVQIPVGSTLITLNCKGEYDEKTVIAMANSIPIDQIARYLQ